MKTELIAFNGTAILYSAEGNILGLYFNRWVISTQVKQNKNKAQTVITKMRRFSRLPSKIKLHLDKACVIPTLHDPTHSLNTLSKHVLLTLQKIQNKEFRVVFDDRFPYQHLTKICT